MKLSLILVVLAACSLAQAPQQEPDVVRGKYDLKVTVTDGIAGTSASQVADFVVK